MTKVQKTSNLYPHPFSKAYWRDAAAELRDTRMLVFTALMIALRVAMKPLSIPIGPSLYINTAFLANALGAMVYGPVVAGLAACITDFLGYLIAPQGGFYFPPYMLTEVAGSMIFALFLYRAKLTPVRVLLSRFCICFGVNVLLQAPIHMWYNAVFMGGKHVILTIPGILKNLFMFPIESVVLTLFLSVMQPITYRMKLTYDKENALHFSKREIVTLAVLFVFGAGCVTGYLSYHYAHNSLSASYTAQQRVEENKRADEIVDTHESAGQNETTMAVVESAYKKFLGEDITYTVASYAMAEGLDESTQADLWKLSKSKAAKEETLTRLGTAVYVVNQDSGELISYEYTPEG
ncbi:MAG: folate family ECF transporter S component [Eubacteriales bacterium]|nr:folate family ECF transporter S component [Eubacteriales bacterium]